jgi:hypothetical protein
MKKLFLISFIFLFCSIMSAQNYNAWFSNPTSGSSDPGSVANDCGSNVEITIGWSGTKANSQNKWKFYVVLNNPVNALRNGQTVVCSGEPWEMWVTEDNPTGTISCGAAQTNNFTIEMYEEDGNGVLTLRTTKEDYFIVPATVYIVNDFGAGTVKINGTNQSCGAPAYVSSSVSLDIDENQVDGDGYNRIWNTSNYYTSDWIVIPSVERNHFGSYSKSYSYSYVNGDNGATIIANTRKQCNLTSNDALTYNGNSSTPGSYVVLTEGVPSTVTAQTYFVTSDYLVHQFTSWADNNSTTKSRSFMLYSHTTYDVNSIVVKPDNGYKNMTFPGTAGDYITVSWSEHPNSNVSQYQIWRRVRHNGVTGSDVCIATVNRGTTTYTDYDYTYTSSFTDDLLWYDVRAYYSPNNSYADAEFVAVYGKMEPLSNQSDDKAIAKASENINIAPVEYSLGSYPNPFNPTTVIRYTMPEAGQVSLKVYNILSQEVANLVESNQPAGVHQVNFNASHLPTGIYIARLQAGAKVITAKLQLVK